MFTWTSNSSKHTLLHTNLPLCLIIVSFVFILFPFDAVLVVRNDPIDDISIVKIVIVPCTCAVFSQQRVIFAAACSPLSLQQHPFAYSTREEIEYSRSLFVLLINCYQI